MTDGRDPENTSDQQIKTDDNVMEELEREGKLKKSVMKGGINNEYENEKPRQG